MRKGGSGYFLHHSIRKQGGASGSVAPKLDQKEMVLG